MIAVSPFRQQKRSAAMKQVQDQLDFLNREYTGLRITDEEDIVKIEAMLKSIVGLKSKIRK